MNERKKDDLRDELLAWHFGCHENPEEFESRLLTDPELLALKNEIEGTSELLARAARDQRSGPDFSALAARESAARARGPWGRIVAVAAAAAALVLAWPLAEWGLAHRDLRRAETAALRLVLSGPAAAPDMSATRYRVETWDPDGRLREADVRWKALGEDGSVVARGAETDARGIDIELPATAAPVRRIEVEAEVPGRVETAALDVVPAQDAPLVHLASDKPVYRPGEPVRFRSVTLKRLSLEARDGSYNFRVVDPRGGVAASFPRQSSIDGVCAFDWQIPAGSAGGLYALEMRDGSDSFTVERLEVEVRDFQAPRFEKSIVLDRETYAPGETGHVSLEVAAIRGEDRAERYGATAILMIDGAEAWRRELQLPHGEPVTASFEIPETVEAGRARLVLRVAAGGAVENRIEPFVIPVGELEVEFSPEGGDLVAGVPNRVYVEVRDRLDRPVSARGRILDAEGREVARLETRHQGRGRFEIAPSKGGAYRLVLEEPRATTATLPPVRDEGVALRWLEETTAPGEPVRVSLESSRPGPWIVGLFCRGALVAQQALEGRGPLEASLLPDASVAGVLRVTVFDSELQPVAERLVHRASGRKIEVAMEFEDQVLAPGAPQTLRVRTSDETGRPVRAVVGVSVADASVGELALEERFGLADRTWLLADTGELEKVEEFLEVGAEGARRVDLLLGTRGWRRFAWFDPKAFVEEHEDEGRRLLLVEGASRAPAVVDRSAAGLAALRAAEDDLRRAERGAGPAGLALGWLLLAGLLVWLAPSLKAAFTGRRGPRRLGRELAFGGLGATAVVLLFGVIALETVAPGGKSMIGGGLFAAGADDARVVERGLVFDAPVDATRSGVTADTGVSLFLRDTLEVGDLHFGTETFTRGVWAQGPGGAARFDLQAGQAGPPGPRGGGNGPGAGIAGAIAGGGGPAHGGAADGVFALDFFADDGTKNADLFVGYVTGIIDNRSPAGRLRMQGFDVEDKDMLRRLVQARLEVSARAAIARIHRHRRVAGEGRRDLADVLLWHPVLVTDEEGRAEVSFEASDRITAWEAAADAHGARRVGQARARFETRLPLSVDLVAPDQALGGDRLRLPVLVRIEGRDVAEARLRVEVSGAARLLGDAEMTTPLEDGAGLSFLDVEVARDGGRIDLDLRVEAGGWRDRALKRIETRPRGFPHSVARSGSLERETRFEIGFPESLHPGSLEAVLKIYPTAMATIRDGLEGMLREPSGCFEQTSSKNYPNILVLDLMESTGQVEPALARRARDLLDKGYAKLVGYECPKKGYEWWGSDPGHEALTAYGLLQFEDMKSVREVDAEMIGRTRTWLMGRRDGEGGYRLDPKSLDSFGRAPKPVIDAYATYALAATGAAEELGRELESLEAVAREGEDSYVLAVAALGLDLAGRDDSAALARSRLARFLEDDGRVGGSATSITRSGGRDLAVETTAFAALAWLRAPERQAEAERAVRWLVSQRRENGTFGATQATVMALKALCAHAEANRAPTGPGTIEVVVNGRPVERIRYDESSRGVLEIPGLARHLEPGVNEVRLVNTGETTFPWTFGMKYRSDLPADDPACPVSLSTTLRQSAIDRGEVAVLDLLLRNERDEGQPMTVAALGLPAGLEIATAVLEDLVEAGEIDFWERLDGDLVLYWRDLAPGREIALALETTGRVPGTSRGAASRAWLYYTPDLRVFAPELEIVVRD